MHLTTQKRVYGLLVSWLIVSLVLAACGNFNAQVAYHTVQVNPDLSGNVSFILIMTPDQYSDVGWYYGDFANTDSRLAKDVADALEWRNYTWNKSREGNNHVLTVSTTFDNARAFDMDILGELALELQNQTVGNSPPELPSGLSRFDGLFNTMFSVTYIWVPAQNPRFPTYTAVTLPGYTIETNGEAGDGNLSHLTLWLAPRTPEVHYAVSVALPEYEVQFDVDLTTATNAVLATTVKSPSGMFESAAAIYGSGNSNQVLGDVWAENLGLNNYELTTGSDEDSGYQTITLTSVYSDRTALVRQLNTIPLFSSVAITETNSFFSNDLALQGTLMPSNELYGKPDNISLTVHLPGQLVGESEDETAAETSSQVFTWGDQATSFRLSSQEEGFSRSTVMAGLGGVILLTLLCGGLVAVVGAIFFFRRRQSSTPKTKAEIA